MTKFKVGFRRKTLQTVKLIIATLCACLMSGCGLDDKQAPVEEMPLMLMDAAVNLPVGDTSVIDVSPYIVGDALHAYLSEVTPQGEQCDALDFDGLQITVKVNQAEVCYYDYTVKTKSVNNVVASGDASLLLLSTTAEDYELPRIFVDMNLADSTLSTLEIDLKAELGGNFPTGFTLQDNVILLGGGQVAVDNDADKLLYTAVDKGIVRLIYNYMDDNDANNLKYGLIDINVSATHASPNAYNFTQVIDVGDGIDIDLTEYVDSTYPGASLQLIDVKAFGLAVSPKYPEDVNNLTLTVEPVMQAGEYSIFYYITDQLGGYAVGAIALSVKPLYDIINWGSASAGGDDSLVRDELDSGVRDVRFMKNGSAAVVRNGAVATWGDSSAGDKQEQLKAGVREVFSNPDGGVMAGLKNDGSLVTWGNDFQGGDSSAVEDKLKSGVESVTVGLNSVAALKVDGSVVVWGHPDRGGKLYDWQQAVLNSGVVSITASERAYAALKDDGSVFAWGDSDYGGGTSDKPKLESGGKQIFSTSANFLVLKDDGSTVSWGQTFNYSYEAVKHKLTGINQLLSTSGGYVALKHDGSVVTWGNFYSRTITPDDVEGYLQSGVKAIVNSNTVYAAIREGGTVVTWGDREYGADTSAVADELKSDVVKVRLNSQAGAAIKADGSVVTWGNPEYGGDSSQVKDELTNVVDIFFTNAAFTALRKDGSLVTWGRDQSGGDSSAVEDKIQSGIITVLGTNSAFSAFKEYEETPLCSLAEACIDLFDTGTGKLFANSPSEPYLDSIGGSATNGIYTENGTNGPAGKFYTFDWDNANLLCDTYNAQNLGGRTNWRLATRDELKVELYGASGNMFTARGWPTLSSYWSATPDGSNYNTVSISWGNVYSYYPTVTSYASCVSNP